MECKGDKSRRLGTLDTWLDLLAVGKRKRPSLLARPLQAAATGVERYCTVRLSLVSRMPKLNCSTTTRYKRLMLPHCKRSFDPS
jgi:hypothetical protein